MPAPARRPGRRTSHQLRSAVILFLGLALTLLGTSVPAVAADTAHLTGTVTGPTGGPLSQISVTAHHVVNGSWDHAYHATTTSMGAYDVSGLPVGTYRLKFEDFQGAHVAEYSDDVATFGEARDIAVGEAAVVSGKNARLADAAHITGMVSGATTLGDIYASVYSLVGGEWQFVRSAVTSSSGAYDVSGLAAGTYRLSFEDDNGRYLREFWDDAGSIETATDIVVTAGDTVANRNATLTSASHITGRVTGPGGAALQGIDVQAYQYFDDDWYSVAYVETTITGAYDLSGLRPGTYRVGFGDRSGDYAFEYLDDATSITTAADVILGSEDVVSDQDAVLGLGAHVKGRVTGPGGSVVPFVDVTAYQHTADSWEVVGRGYVDQSGNYDLGGLAAGTYRIGFYDASERHVEEFYDDAATVDAAADITVTAAGLVTGKDAELAASVSSDGAPPPIPAAGIPTGPSAACTAARVGAGTAAAAVTAAQAKATSAAAKVKKLKKVQAKAAPGKLRTAKKKAKSAASAKAASQRALIAAQAAVTATCR